MDTIFDVVFAFLQKEIEHNYADLNEDRDRRVARSICENACGLVAHNGFSPESEWEHFPRIAKDRAIVMCVGAAIERSEP